MPNSTQPTILKQIVADKRQWIAEQQIINPLANFHQQLTPSERDFYQALQPTNNRPAYILECKKASPSKGVIRADFSPSDIAKIYKNYASVISVLTDKKYFQGDFAYIEQVRNIAPQPILCKDFIICDYQIYLARCHGADAILLMLSILNDKQYQRLANTAHSLGMGVLTETANEEEVQRAINLQAKVIGINNRNLHDLTVDIERTPQLAQAIPTDRIIISESGIKHNQHIQKLQTHANGFLIGSSLMVEEDLNSAVRRLIYGENKVCGLTRAEDCQSAYQNGAYFGGLIFAPKSKRLVTLQQAKNLIVSVPLKFVGVFQNQEISEICQIADELKLFAVQLHGDENQAFINKLRQKLAKNVEIWRAISVDINLPQPLFTKEGRSPPFSKGDLGGFSKLSNFKNIDHYVFDTKVGQQQGGTGQVFDWSIIPQELKNKSMLAGGLNAENIMQAKQQDFLGLDINSGAETSAGIKDNAKLSEIFTKLLQ